MDAFTRVLEVNTLGPLRMAQAVMPAWRERGSGVLVNISSVQGKIGTPLEGAYAASKHALEALSETLYFELGHFGIRVVIVEPGYIAPGMKHQDDHRGPALYDDLHAQWGATVSTLVGPRDGRVPSWWRSRWPTRWRTRPPRCGSRWERTPQWCWSSGAR